MPGPAFAQLVGALVEAMGQTLTSLRQVPEGFLLRTTDGFVYAFLENPADVSLADVQRVFDDANNAPLRVVIFTPGRLPLALAGEVAHRGSTLVDGPRFQELVRSLGLSTLLGEEPRPAMAGERSRLLPSAQQLDGIMTRGRTWLDWGVPALALRFYRQAVELKQEFLPAKVGVGRALLALGLASDAEKVFDEVLADHPGDLGARLGKATVYGAKGNPREEIAIYRELLAEDPKRAEVRAHLIAALVDQSEWRPAREEIELMLRSTPEDPRLRFLHAATLAKTGQTKQADEERRQARDLGLTPEAERSLSAHLSLAGNPVQPAESPPTSSAAGGRRHRVLRGRRAPPAGSRGPRAARRRRKAK